MGLLARLFGRPRVRSINTAQAHTIVEEGAQFLDVRNRSEFRQGHAKGARNVALGALPNAMRRLDKERPVVCICQSGVRSGQAARRLVDAGFPEVYSVRGGSLAWAANGLPWE